MCAPAQRMARPNQSPESDEKPGSKRLGLLRQPEITWHPRKRGVFFFIYLHYNEF
jgi:hypothetical protein